MSLFSSLRNNDFEDKLFKPAICVEFMLMFVALVLELFLTFNSKIIGIILNLLIILIVVIPLLFLVLKILKVVIVGYDKWRKCEIEEFREFDSLKHCYGSSKNNYNRIIKLLNYYYDGNGEIGELIRNKNLIKLLGRLEFLNKQSTYHYNVYVLVSAVTTSVIASCVIIYFQYAYSIPYLILLIVCMLLLFLLLFFVPFYQNGREGSYMYILDEYEKERLERAIHNIFVDTKAKDSKEVIAIEQQIKVIRKLSYLSEKGTKKEREKIKDIISILQSLDLETVDAEKLKKVLDSFSEILKEGKTNYASREILYDSLLDK